MSTEEGRVVRNPSNGTYRYEYNLKDHLGNVRVSFDDNGGVAREIQRDDYYAFGLNVSKSLLGDKNNYLYNGKEEQDVLSDMYDYGARFHDPVLARWNVIDPLAEKGRRWSPYVYGFNNPIRFTDPDGMWPDPDDVGLFHTAVEFATGSEADKLQIAGNVTGDIAQLTLAAGDIGKASEVTKMAKAGEAAVTGEVAEVGAKLKGSSNPAVSTAINRGKQAHAAFSETVPAKYGWEGNVRMIDPKTGKAVIADAVSPSGHPVELKPNTASGRAQGKRQLPQYERATGTNGRVIYYNP